MSNPNSTIRDIVRLLNAIERGKVVRGINADMATILERLHDLSLDAPKRTFKGVLDIKVVFAVVNSTVTVGVEVTTKTPKDEPLSSIFWLDRDGNITTEHPTQLDMLRPHAVDDDDEDEREAADA